MNHNGTKNGTFDLAAASKFLNIREPTLAILAEQGRVPARKIGKGWRFTKARLEKWMRDEREPSIALLQQAGVHRDDSDLFPMLAEIYKARGRPVCEEE